MDGQRRGPLGEGELAFLLDERGRRYLLTLTPGAVFHSHAGKVEHRHLIGREEGEVVASHVGRPFLLLRPTLEDYLLHLRRRTQILYPKDIGFLLLRGEIFPGARVLEAGVGSGALACALLRYLGPEGRLYGYEVRPDFLELARENLRYFHGEMANAELRLADVYEGIEERDLDTVILDLPEPWRALPGAIDSLRPGGVFLAWLPTTLQVHRLVMELGEMPVGEVEVVELLLRPWHVTRESMRPEHRMVAHTGFLVSARRLKGGAWRKRRESGGAKGSMEEGQKLDPPEEGAGA